jgi:hypothetical protein
MRDANAVRLGPISCITVTVPELGAAEACYSRYFDYRVAGRGAVTERQAELWRAPALAGRRYLLLAPAAGDECVFRFIEAPVDAQYVPFSTFGWNAAEIMVQDVDALARQLDGSPFEIVGEPQNLSFTDDIRAMQILGPGRELLYLTEFKQPVPGLDTPEARCPVDSVFIVILGGPAMDDLQAYYGRRFGVPAAPVMESRVKGMSAAFGNAPDHKYPIAALPLAGRNLIEVDEMPAAASARPVRDGYLPAGIAIVSFVGDGPDGGTPPVADEPPYRDAGRVSCDTGPAGELLEIVSRA